MGHRRAVSYTSWVPAATIRGIKKHLFYTLLVRSSNYIDGTPVIVRATPTQLAAAAREMTEHLRGTEHVLAGLLPNVP